MTELGPPQKEFQDYCDRFVSYLGQSGLAQLTLKNYRSDLKAFGQWLEASEAGALNPTTFRNKEMEQYQEFLLTDKKLHPNSVKRRLGTLRKFYTWLQQIGVAQGEPLPKLPFLSQTTRVAREALSHADQLNLLKAVEQGQSLRDIAMIKLMLYAGLRAGELCHLCWSDIKMMAHESQLLVGSASSKRSRTIVLPSEVFHALVDLGYQTKAGSQEPVFVGQRGAMTSRGVQEVVKKYAKQAGLGTVAPYMLRYTYIARLLEQGVRLSDVASFLGSSAETMLHYERALEGCKRQNSNVNEIFDPTDRYHTKAELVPGKGDRHAAKGDRSLPVAADA